MKTEIKLKLTLDTRLKMILEDETKDGWIVCVLDLSTECLCTYTDEIVTLTSARGRRIVGRPDQLLPEALRFVWILYAFVRAVCAFTLAWIC